MVHVLNCTYESVAIIGAFKAVVNELVFVEKVVVFMLNSAFKVKAMVA